MGQIMDWVKEQELIDRQKQKEVEEKMKRIMADHEQKQLDHQMADLKKAFGIKSPSQEMMKVGQAMMDTSDMSTVSRDNHTIIDPLLKEFKDVTWAQQDKVLASGKYPHPIHKDNHTALEWMDHQMSEFADALVYHQCLKQTIADAVELIRLAYGNSNDPQVDGYLLEALERLRG